MTERVDLGSKGSRNRAERLAKGLQLEAHLAPQCRCECHDDGGHCDTCCTETLCSDCLSYAMEG